MRSTAPGLTGIIFGKVLARLQPLAVAVAMWLATLNKVDRRQRPEGKKTDLLLRGPRRLEGDGEGLDPAGDAESRGQDGKIVRRRNLNGRRAGSDVVIESVGHMHAAVV